MSTIENTVVDNYTPSEFYLGQNYPNPFIEKTIIKFCVAYKTKVRLEVFNSERKMIKILIDEEKEAGTYEIEFNAVETGHAPSLQSKTYYYQLIAGDYKCEKRMALKK